MGSKCEKGSGCACLVVSQSVSQDFDSNIYRLAKNRLNIRALLFSTLPSGYQRLVDKKDYQICIAKL